MPKAKLTTRERTTSNVSTDTLAKGTQLTHAEADSNFINLRDQSFGIADDSSTVLQVSADKTITIAGGTGITTALSGDTLTITAQSQAQGITFSGDDSAGINIADGGGLYIQGGTNVTTSANSDGTITINAADPSSAETVTALSSSTNITVDRNLGSVFTVTLAHNAAFTFSNLGTGQTVSVRILQDGTGERTGTFSGIIFPDGDNTLSTAANYVDFLTIFNDGTYKLGVINRHYS